MHTKIAAQDIQTERGCEAAAYKTTLTSKHSVPPVSDATGIYPRPSTWICGNTTFLNHIARNRWRCFDPCLRRPEPSASSAAAPAALTSVISSADWPKRPSSASSATTREMPRTERVRNAHGAGEERARVRVDGEVHAALLQVTYLVSCAVDLARETHD